MANVLKIKRGSSEPSSSNDVLEHYELGYRTGTTELYINDGGTYRQLGGGATTSGSNNQLLTDNGSGGITSESSLEFAGQYLSIQGNDPSNTYGVKEKLRIHRSGNNTDRQLQIYEMRHSGGREFLQAFNLDITTDNSSGYTYTQGSYGGSSHLEFDNAGALKIYNDSSVSSGSRNALTPSLSMWIKDDNNILMPGRLGIGWTAGTPARALDVKGGIELSANDNTLDTNNFTLRRDSGGGGNIDVPGDMTINIDANDNQTNAVFEICANGSATGVFKVGETGIVTTGTWNGTPIASAYLDADTAHLSGTQTFSGIKTFSSPVSISQNGGVLNLIGTDHAYIQYYPDGTSNGRKAYVGFGSASNDQFTIANESSDQDMKFIVNDGGSNKTGIWIDSSDNASIKLPNDGQYLRMGASNDIYLGHDGSNTLFGNYTGYIQFRNLAEDQDIFLSVNDGGSHIHAMQIDASDAGSAIFSHDVKVNDNGKLKAGSGNDFTIHHDGTNSYINNYTGHIYFTTEAEDKNLVFRSDDGSNGVANYFIVDGGSQENLFYQNTRLKADQKSLSVGANNDLRMIHDTHSYLQNTSSSMLVIQNTGQDQDIAFMANDNGSNNHVMRIQGATGRVGIGVTAPEDLLHVHSTGDTTVRIKSTSNKSQIRYQNDAQSWYTGISSNEEYFWYGSQISGNAGFIQGSSGNLYWEKNLILSVNAKYLYSRDASGTLTRMLGMNSSNITYIGPIDSYAGGEIYYGASSNAGNHRWWVGGTERMRITPSSLIILPQNQNEGGEIALSPGTDPSYTTTFYLDSRQNKFRIHSSGSERFTIATDGTLTLNGTVTGSAIKDQDDMSSNSASHLATQQSIKAYVDANAGTTNASDLSSGTVPLARLNIPSSGDWFSGGVPTVATDGVMEIGRFIDFHNTDTTTDDYDVRLDNSGDNQLDIQTGVGYIRLGPQNVHWSHIYTDRQGHLFDKNLTALDGKFQSYQNVDLNLRRSQGDTDRLLIQSGISTFSNQLHIEKGLSVDPKTHHENGDGRFHLNVLQHRDNANRTGAIIIDTDIARTSNRMSVIHVHGYGYGQNVVIDFKVCFYPYSGHNGPDGNSGSVIAYSLTDDGSDGKPKFLGINSSGNVAIAIDDYNGAGKYFYNFQVDFYNGTSPVQLPTWDVSYSTTDGFGWIQKHTLKAPIKQIRTANNVYTSTINGKLGVGVDSPEEEVDIIGSLKVRGDGHAASELLELGQFSNGATTPQYTVSTFDSAGGIANMGDHLQFQSVRWGQSITFSRNGQGGAVPTALFYNAADTGYMDLYRALNPTADATNQVNVRLHVNGNSFLRGGALTIGDTAPLTTGGTPRLSLRGAGFNIGNGTNDMSYIRSTVAGEYQWQTWNGANDGELQLQPYGGKVGVGTTAPVATMHVEGSTRLNGDTVVGPNNNNSKAFIRANNGYSAHNTPDYTWYYNDTCGIFHPAGNVIGFSAGGEKFRVDSGGTLTTGQTRTTNEFQVNSNGTTLRRYVSTWNSDVRTHDVLYNGYASTLGDYAYYKTSGNTATTHGMLLSSDNYLFWGRANIETGDVSNSATAPIADVCMRVDASGNGLFDGDVVAFSTTIASDARLKENVKDLNYGLKDVLDIRPVSFDWKEKRNGQHDIGVIAQEIEKIIPEVVVEVDTLNSEDTHKTVDYAKLTSVLIKAVQEQQQQINELKEKLNG